MLLSKNGFYPINKGLLNFIHKDQKSKYVGNFISSGEIYPCKFILIAYKLKENKIYYQKITINNEAQKIKMLQLALSKSNVIYEEDFNNKEEISQDYILSIHELNQIMSVKKL